MSTVSFFGSKDVLMSDIENSSNQLNTVSYVHEIDKLYPPESLNTQGRIQLGVKVLEKFGQAAFAYFQRTYRLTREESDTIFSQTTNYAKDLALWEPIGLGSIQHDLELVKDMKMIQAKYPDAHFFRLTIKEENHRTLNVVEFEGKRYYFYSQAYKGPVVDGAYITNYETCRKMESRPDFKVLEKDGRTIFLMEFVSEKTPDFRDERHLSLLVDLIFRFSLNKKGLDMLPARLAMKEGKLFCVDQKLKYGCSSTQIEAFKHNIDMLKGKIAYRGYAEEGQLLALVDKLAKKYELEICEKSLDNLRYVHEINTVIPSETLTSDEKVSIAAAVLRKYGTKDLNYVGRVYSLSVEEKLKARRLAGELLINNTVTWQEVTSARSTFSELQKKTEMALNQQGLKGEFATYINRVGNYKDVLTVKIDGEMYVVREADQKYVDEYQSRKEREHRPEFRVLPLEGDTFVFLAKFMGPQTVNYADSKHVDLMIDLAWNFSNGDTSTIDRNLGNLIVCQEKLYYIDKDLRYSASEHPRLHNLKDMFDTIDEFFHTEQEKALCKNYVREKIRPLLNPQEPKDLEILQNFFPLEFPKPDPLNLETTYQGFIERMDIDNEDHRRLLMEKLPALIQPGTSLAIYADLLPKKAGIFEKEKMYTAIQYIPFLKAVNSKIMDIVESWE